MIVDRDQLQPYLDDDADIIALHVWNKQTIRKGKTQLRGKTPFQGDWPSLPKNIKATLELAKKGHNVGYRLGDRDLIIDVDPRNFKPGENSLVKLLEFLGIEDLSEIAPTVITGSGGWHYYMTKPADFMLKEMHEDFPGIEFKTKGRQVVAAGSKHPNGEMYIWEDFCPELHERPKVPGRLVKLLKREAPKQSAEAGSLSPEQLEKLLDQIPIDDFDTNDSWFPLLCAAHHGTNGTGVEEFVEWSCGDMEFEEDAELIRARWDSLGGKSLNYTVNTLFKTVLTYGGTTSVVSAQSDFDGVGNDNFEQEEGDTTGKAKEEDIDFDDVVSEQEAKAGYSPGVATDIANKLNPNSSEEEIVVALRAMLQAGTIEQARVMKIVMRTLHMTKAEVNDILKQIREQIAEDLGRILAEKTLDARFYKGKGLVFNNNGQFWAYNGKFWETITKEYVGKKVTQVLDAMRKKVDIKVKETTIVNEAVSTLSRIAATREDALRLREKPYPVINCNNGELWISDDGTVKLKKHRPSSFMLQLLNVEYSPGAECPLFDESIRKTFANFEDSEDIVRHFEEFMGYVLHPDKRPAHWWLLKGPGGDGKTTLMKIISGILGDAVLPESIDRFKGGAGGDNHAFAELVGKLLVYDDDLNRNAILPDGTLKKLSEDGEITANPKGYQGFKFTKVCTVAMLSNGFPSTRDITRGFRRRAMVIPFNRGFHEEGAITDLAEQIADKELAGVLNRALQGLQRLRARGNFREPVSCEKAKMAWLHASNPVALFISEKINHTNVYEDTVSLGDAYSTFTEWAMNNSIKKIGTKQDFRAAMEDMDIAYTKAGGNKNVFRFVSLVEEDIGDFDTEDDDFE